jgi:hypothetical protein
LTGRKARASLRGLAKQFGTSSNANAGDAESLAYLDLVSHSIIRTHPGQADPARRVVEEAEAYQVVASAAVLDNMAWVLGSLVELAPMHPDAITVVT